MLTIAVFLLAGAVVNVAVAWGCSVWSIRGRSSGVHIFSRVPPTVGGHRWLRESDWNLRPEDDDFVWKAAYEFSGFGLERKGFHLYHPDVTPGQGGPFSVASLVVRDRSGWPLRALQGELWVIELEHYRDNPRPPRWFFESRFAIAKVRVTSFRHAIFKDNRLLAYLPIWPGFAINTTFYAGILWPLIFGPFALRRLMRQRRRQRRGLCPACGYDLRHGEHQACPECGVTA